MTVDQAKAHIRIDVPYEDAIVPDWIAAATRKVEHDTGLLLMPRQVRLTAEGFTGSFRPALYPTVELPVAPVRGVVSITYVDRDGTLQTLAGTAYTVIGRRLYAAGGIGWPATVYGRPVVVTVDAGYATVDAVPADLKQAVRLVVSWLYQNREPAPFEEQVYQQWIWPYRTVLIG